MSDEKREQDLATWMRSDWLKQRTLFTQLKGWYKGIPLDETMPKQDRATGEPIKKFPLRINLIRLACDMHRDLARGMPEYDDALFVRTEIEGSDNRNRQLENVLNNRVWRPSRGGAIQQAGLLSMNIFGSAIYKISHMPWRSDLPERLQVYLVPNPGFVLLVGNYLDPWDIREAHFGYEISPEEAQVVYGITPRDTNMDCLYMEHWTPREWSIHVDGETPTMEYGNNQKQKLEGENAFGFIPFFYIPHEYILETMGGQHIRDQGEIEKDLNSRLTVLSDLLQSIRPGVLWGRNLNAAKVVPISGQGLNFNVVDAGRSTGTPGQGSSKDPHLDALPVAELPTALGNLPDLVMHFWMLVARVSPAAFGMDDTQSGRITGPAVAQRMFSSLAHASTERINFSEGKSLIDRAILLALARNGNELGVSEDEIYELLISQQWPPKLPMDREIKHREMYERYQGRAISRQEYHRQMGSKQPDAEINDIRAWENEELQREIQIVEAGQSEPGSTD